MHTRTNILIGALGLALLSLSLTSCGGTNYQGVYTGTAWKDESKGTTLDAASEKVEATIELDRRGVITNATLNFLVQGSDGTWKRRNDTTSEVSIDYTVNPAPAIPQTADQPYKAGTSMFKISTNDRMSFWAAGVSTDGTAAFAMVDPIHRYQSEVKFEPGFDFSQPISSLTIGSGLLVPTVRTSSGGYLRPASWAEYADKHLFAFYRSSYVYTGKGTFQGLTPDSTIADLLGRTGVVFTNGRPGPMDPAYGFYANGGWAGNYNAIGAWLKGKKATEVLSLIDWSVPRYAGGINADNFFGIDAAAGATKTVQNSTDGIAGATVRMSRESNAYQRALVAAGILTESQVIKGRF